jgi:hypothetical protein
MNDVRVNSCFRDGDSRGNALSVSGMIASQIVLDRRSAILIAFSSEVLRDLGKLSDLPGEWSFGFIMNAI